jgi:hypothetical protein
LGWKMIHGPMRPGRSNEFASTCRSTPARDQQQQATTPDAGASGTSVARRVQEDKLPRLRHTSAFPRTTPVVVTPSREVPAFSPSSVTGRAPSTEVGMAVLLRSTASATAGPSSALLTISFRRGRLLRRVSRPRRALAARASAVPLEVCAKESLTVPGCLGDCERSRPLFTLSSLLCAHRNARMMNRQCSSLSELELHFLSLICCSKTGTGEQL